jgi:ATP-dependent Zn protease
MLFMLLNKSQTQYARIPLSAFNRLLKENVVAEVELEGDKVLGELREPRPVGEKGEQVEKFQASLPAGTSANWQFTSWLLSNAGDARVTVSQDANLLLNIIMPLIPWLLIFGFIWFILFRQLRPSGTAQSKAPLKVFVVNQAGQQDEEASK